MPMKNVNIGFESLISDMVKAGTSIEDIATLFADALNTESVKAAAAKKAKEAKERDALTIMQMISAFMSNHYGDKSWDDELINRAAKEFVNSMDMAQEFAKSLDKLAEKAKPVADKMVKKSDFDDAVAEFEKLLKSL